MTEESGGAQALVLPSLSGESAGVQRGLFGAFLVGAALAAGCVTPVDLIAAPDGGADAGEDAPAPSKADASDPKLVDAGADSAK